MIQIFDDSFSIILPSNDTSNIANEPSNFTIVYEKPFVFDENKECAISSIIFPKCLIQPKIIYILSDIVQQSIVNNVNKNVLRTFKIENDNIREINFFPLLFVPLKYREINSINIFITDENFSKLSFEEGSLIINLRLRDLDHN